MPGDVNERLSGAAGTRVLDLSRLRLTTVPPAVRSLTTLERLDLYGNELTTLPEWLSELRALRQLSVSGNRLRSIPDFVSSFKHLQQLFVYDNEITVVPKWIGELNELLHLALARNEITVLADSLRWPTQLIYLDIEKNKISSLPDSIGDLRSLSTLRASRNELTTLPSSFANLTSLVELDLSNNRLISLPDSIGLLSQLKELNVSRNSIETLPTSIGDIKSLRKLDVAANRLTAIPHTLAPLLNGRLSMNLSDNPLLDPLPDLISRGDTALATYLSTLDDAVAIFEAKVMLVGEGNVGKTSLRNALAGRPFVPALPTTHGIEIDSLNLPDPGKGVTMTLRLWDFGGQEVYRISHQFFFGPRALYLVVWYPRDGWERNEVEGWLRRIRLRVDGHARAIVVATHSRDRVADLDYTALERQMPELLAGRFSVDNEFGDGIADLRARIAVEAGRLPQMGQRLSPRWLQVRDAVAELARSQPQISFKRFVEICEFHKVTGAEIRTLANLLHDLGHVVYYGEDDGLADIVVLNPEWLTKAISHILEDRTTIAANGILDHGRLRGIWLERLGYPAEFHRYFLRLMEKFDISYRLTDDERKSLVAQLVPHERPPLPWAPDVALPSTIRRVRLVVQLSEPAPGLVAWLTVRHHYASAGLHWRTGVFLRHPVAAYRSEALLHLESPDRLMIEVRAASPDMFLNVLRDSVEHLIRLRWPGLRYQFQVPCPGIAASTNGPCEGRFPLEGLSLARQAQESSYRCLWCQTVHDTSELLTGFATQIPDGGRGSEILTELKRLEHKVDGVSTGVTRISELASDGVASIRRVIRTLDQEVTDCPRFFSVAQIPGRGWRRLRMFSKSYRVMLWCEQPGRSHPWPSATYSVDEPRKWLVETAPYIRTIFRTLKVVVPLASEIVELALPKAASQKSAADELRRMSDLIEKLADLVGADDLAMGTVMPVGPSEGRALRAFRQWLFGVDGSRGFGDLRRARATSGEFLWVCPTHYREYDPGLPEIPA